jgi:hypothetical protein
MDSPEQLDLLVWGKTRPTAEVIDIVDRIALRIWYRRFWPRPQQYCVEPITLSNRKRGAA